jgi:hypothetical protein
MKKILTIIGLFVTCAEIFAQGQVVFDNTVQVPNGAPIWLVGQVGIKGPGSSYTAGLYLQNGGSLTPLGTTTFLDVANGAYLNPVTLDVPVAPGSSVAYQVLVWETSAGSYDLAPATGKGSSGPFAGTVGGGTLPPTNLDNLTSFTVGIVPEPSTLAFGILAVIALPLFRPQRLSFQRK